MDGLEEKPEIKIHIQKETEPSGKLHTWKTGCAHSLATACSFLSMWKVPRALLYARIEKRNGFASEIFQFLPAKSKSHRPCFYDTARTRRWLSTCFSRQWKTWERGHQGRVTGDNRQTTLNWHIPSSRWHTLVPKVSLSATWISGSLWMSLKGMDDILSPCDKPPTPSYLCSWAPPSTQEDRTCRTTLCEPPEFTISLSRSMADAPQAAPLKYFCIKSMDFYFSYYYCWKLCLIG